MLGYFYLHQSIFDMSRLNQYFRVPHEELYRKKLLRENIKQTRLKDIEDLNFIVIREGVHLMKTARILCFVMFRYGKRYPGALRPWDVIRHTWGDRCAKLIFFTDNGPDISDPSLEVYPLDGHDPRSWSGMQTAIKTISSAGYLRQYKWFLKVEHDTYVVMENLAYYLSVFDFNTPHYFGHPCSLWSTRYNSGGAGYVLSQAALRKVLSLMLKGHCEKSFTAEDVNIGK